MIDQVTEIQKGKEARAVKCVTYSDDIMRQHFYEDPVMPGVLIVEGLGQLGAFLLVVSLYKEDESPKHGMLLEIQNMKFHRPVVPGECMDYYVQLESLSGDIAAIKVEARCKGELVCRGKIKHFLRERSSQHSDPICLEAWRGWTRHLKDCPPFR